MLRPTIIILSLPCLMQAQTVFDPTDGFSLTTNPNHEWQYGYSETRSLDPGQFRLDKYGTTAGLIGFWHPEMTDKPGPGYYPYIAFNTTKQSQYGSSNGWSIRPGEITMEASNTGQYSLLRFIAPESGTYEISARFAGVHFGLSTTDVHVLHNAVSLFDAFIEGYGGDGAFHKIEGASPAADYSGRIELKARDTITFACGYGRNQTHFSDTTGLIARIVLIHKTP
jgi:hypothetical protein